MDLEIKSLESVMSLCEEKRVLYMWLFSWCFISRISRVRPRENFHFNISLFIVMKTSEIKPLQISPPSPKLRKYLYAKYTCMAYTVSILCM